MINESITGKENSGNLDLIVLLAKVIHYDCNLKIINGPEQ